MNLLPCAMPCAPDWRVDWPAITEQLEWVQAMKGCPQDPQFHAEGDVWIHVGMVCVALAELPEFRVLPESERQLVFAAALFHDIAKPRCTRVEGGRITSRGHSHRGSVHARRILWESGADIQLREQVCSLIRYHQVPFYLIQRPDARCTAYRVSQSTRCDLLALLAKADALGRKCTDQDDLLTRIDLFREFCSEEQCLDRPRAFASDLSRFQYFRAEDRDPNYLAHDDSTCEVILMSGLPGAGKDTWIRRHVADLPLISLDDIREHLGASPTGNQGAVIHAARERARVLLRAGQGFVWNATNLSQDIRSQLIDLFTSYKARTRIVYVETDHGRLFARNRDRADAVPPSAIDGMMDRWEVPDPTEAQAVEIWGNSETAETVHINFVPLMET
jgi:predicted kinase